MTLVWLYAVRALFCPYGAGTSGQHGPNFIPGAVLHWSYVKKKYKLNTTNFLFLCNC